MRRARRISRTEVEAERARQREGGDAQADQRLAQLFVECGWTQHKIAEHLGKGQA
jgi:hypothetical protein